MVTAGDNVYGEGSPDRFGEAWKRPFGWVRTAGVPVIASLGNHDIETDGGDLWEVLVRAASWS